VIEAPRDMKTVSEQTLAWNTPDHARPAWLKNILNTRTDAPASTDDDRIVIKWNSDLSRSEIFKLNDDNRWRLWRRLHNALQTDPSLYGS
jgi:hypothetical protein